MRARARLRMGRDRWGQPVGLAGVRVAAGRRWDASPTGRADRPGPVGAVRRDRAYAGQGRADRRAPSRRAPREHDPHGRRHQGARRRFQLMRIAVSVGPGKDSVPFVQEAERLGVHSVWTAEAWGYDALTPLAYVAAKTSKIKLGSGIVQVGARTPAMVAMSAMTMQALSDGRFILGLGTSGPQVIEGWHGVPFRNAVKRTKETIEIVRKITRGERSDYAGDVCTLPLPGGAGRAIRSSAPPTDVPIYVASLGPQNLRMTGALADGWVGTSFMPETAEAFFQDLRTGAESAGRSLADLDLQVAAGVEFTDDVEEAAKRHARGYAFTFGAMGS